MRNLTDEQVAEVALELVEDHLREGVAFGVIVDALEDPIEDDDEYVEEDDILAVAGQVQVVLRRLINTLELP